MKISGGGATTARRSGAVTAPRKTARNGATTVKNGPKTVRPPPGASISWIVEFQPRFRPAPVSGNAELAEKETTQVVTYCGLARHHLVAGERYNINHQAEYTEVFGNGGFEQMARRRRRH